MDQNSSVLPEAPTLTGPTRVLVCGTSWASGHPQLLLRIDGEPSAPVTLAGLELRYSVADATQCCVGHKPFRDHSATWVDCDNAPLHDGYKCDRCAANDAVFASQLHHAHTRGTGELDASMQSHLAQENVLYLAAFRDGSLKVGTSTAHRVETRLAEQGAWQAQIVARATNGIAVREIEAQVTTDLGIAQSVSARRKLSGLANPVPTSRLSNELDQWTAAVHRLIDSLAVEQVTPTSQRWSSPVAMDGVWERVSEYPLKLRTGNHHLQFITASGRLGVFTRPAVPDVFAADLRALFGLELTISAVEPDELVVQDSLF